MAKNIYIWNEKRLKKITIEVKEEFALPNSTSIIITYKREDRDDKSWSDNDKATIAVYMDLPARMREEDKTFVLVDGLQNKDVDVFGAPLSPFWGEIVHDNGKTYRRRKLVFCASNWLIGIDAIRWELKPELLKLYYIANGMGEFVRRDVDV